MRVPVAVWQVRLLTAIFIYYFTLHISDCRHFSDIHISQGSVATYLRCGGICKHEFVANLSLSLPVKEFWKSVNIWGSYEQQFNVLFFDALSRSKCSPTNNSGKYDCLHTFIHSDNITASLERGHVFHSDTCTCLCSWLVTLAGWVHWLRLQTTPFSHHLYVEAQTQHLANYTPRGWQSAISGRRSL